MTASSGQNAKALVEVVAAATADVGSVASFDIDSFKRKLASARQDVDSFEKFRRQFSDKWEITKWLDGSHKEELISAMAASNTFAELTLQLQAIVSALAIQIHSNTECLSNQQQQIFDQQAMLLDHRDKLPKIALSIQNSVESALQSSLPRSEALERFEKCESALKVLGTTIRKIESACDLHFREFAALRELLNQHRNLLDDVGRKTDSLAHEVDAIWNRVRDMREILFERPEALARFEEEERTRTKMEEVISKLATSNQRWKMLTEVALGLSCLAIVLVIFLR